MMCELDHSPVRFQNFTYNSETSSPVVTTPVVVNDYVPEHARHAVVVCFAQKVIANVHVTDDSEYFTASIESPFIVVVSAMTVPVSFR